MSKTKEKTLLSHVRELLRARPRTLTFEQISADLDVSVSWLNAVCSGKIKEPSVNAIQALYEYLAKRPLSF